jgi:hypothetical protein
MSDRAVLSSLGTHQNTRKVANLLHNDSLETKCVFIEENRAEYKGVWRSRNRTVKIMKLLVMEKIA